MLRNFLEKSGCEKWSEDQLVLLFKSLTPLRLFVAQSGDGSIKERLDYLMDHLSDRNDVPNLYFTYICFEFSNSVEMIQNPAFF